jgi:hypothetical membrane protein
MQPITGFLVAFFKYFGLAGTAIILLAVIYSALGYRGRRQEAYSLLNHFISELGEVGVSGRAWAFNAAMIAAGLLLVPFIIGLGLALGNLWGILSIFAGLWAAISCALVGVFPMNNLAAHSRAAISYFRGGLVMVVLFGVAIWLQPAGAAAVSGYANLFSLAAVAAYATFLILLGRKPKKTAEDPQSALDPAKVPERPRFWLLPALEWVVFFSTVLWLFGVAMLS